MPHFLDITKDTCPVTLVKVKVKLANMKTGERVEVLLSDGEPLKNVSKTVEDQGHKVIDVQPDGRFYKVIIEK